MTTDKPEVSEAPKRRLSFLHRNPQPAKRRLRQRIPFKRLMPLGVVVALLLAFYVAVGVVFVKHPSDPTAKSSQTAAAINYTADQFRDASYLLDTKCDNTSPELVDRDYQPTCELNADDSMRRNALAYAGQISFVVPAKAKTKSKSKATPKPAPVPEGKPDHSDYKDFNQRQLLAKVYTRAFANFQQSGKTAAKKGQPDSGVLRLAWARTADASRPVSSKSCLMGIIDNTHQCVQRRCWSEGSAQDLKTTGVCLDTAFKRSIEPSYDYIPRVGNSFSKFRADLSTDSQLSIAITLFIDAVVVIIVVVSVLFFFWFMTRLLWRTAKDRKNRTPKGPTINGNGHGHSSDEATTLIKNGRK